MLDFDFGINETEEIIKGYMEQYEIDDANKQAILESIELKKTIM